MARLLISLIALFLCVGNSFAQTNAPATPNQVPSAAQLQQYLNRWEQEMLKVQTLAATIKLIEKDKTFETTSASIGVAKYMKLGSGTSTVNLASLELRREGKADLDKKFLCTGNYLYQVLFEAKEIRAFEMPKPKQGQVAEDSFMPNNKDMKLSSATCPCLGLGISKALISLASNKT